MNKEIIGTRIIFATATTTTTTNTEMETKNRVIQSKDNAIHESYGTLNEELKLSDNESKLVKTLSAATTTTNVASENNVSNEFLSKISELWIENSHQKQRIFNNTKKELPLNILDDITPPGNRNNLKNFSSSPTKIEISSSSNNNNNNIINTNNNIDHINSNNHHHYYYEHTPINGINGGGNNINGGGNNINGGGNNINSGGNNINSGGNGRNEKFISKQHHYHQQHYNDNGTTLSSTPLNKIDNPLPSTNINTNNYSIISNNNNDSLYEMKCLHSNNDQLYSNYNIVGSRTSNNIYKSTVTTPHNSINDHITMLGDSFNKLSTLTMNCGDDHKNYYNNCCCHGNSSLWSTSGVTKLPHPSFAPQLPTINNRSYIGNNSRINSPRFNVPPPRVMNDFQKNCQYPIQSVSDYNGITTTNGNLTSDITFQNPNKPSLSWIGKFPIKNHPDPLYSNKVFLGGLPWDITEQGLYTVFKQFGPCTFEWPGKDNRSTRHPPKGYVYLIFENERSVKNLLQYCYHDEQRTQFYFKLKTHITSNEKSIQIIPWILANSSYLKCSSEILDITKTVFVGGLHGKITAENLALVFEELFGNVIYAGIDTDKNKYPIGSGRVTFDNLNSYKNAIQASFVQINGKNFCKKVQIDPYLEDSVCQFCSHKNGPFFCKDFDCLKYYCKDCWIIQHCNPSIPSMINHKPINRQNSSDVFEILNSIHFYSQVIDHNNIITTTTTPQEIINITNNHIKDTHTRSD